MIYTVVIVGRTAEAALGEALCGKRIATRHVYVVGLSEGSVLANALDGKDVSVIEDPSAADVLQFAFSEIVGMEDPHTIEQAKGRALQLQAQHPSPIARFSIQNRRAL
jgi:hypothetical protein